MPWQLNNKSYIIKQKKIKIFNTFKTKNLRHSVKITDTLFYKVFDYQNC